MMSNSLDPENRSLDPLTRALGFAGILPQAFAVLALAWSAARDNGSYSVLAIGAALLALVYGAVILSFLGGIWWGLALQRPAGAQGQLALLAVVPPLVAVGLVVASAVIRPGWVLVALGSAILLTLLQDRRLTDLGEAPADWMRLRVPLSGALGTLTIVAGVLTAH